MNQKKQWSVRPKHTPTDGFLSASNASYATLHIFVDSREVSVAKIDPLVPLHGHGRAVEAVEASTACITIHHTNLLAPITNNAHVSSSGAAASPCNYQKNNCQHRHALKHKELIKSSLNLILAILPHRSWHAPSLPVGHQGIACVSRRGSESKSWVWTCVCLLAVCLSSWLAGLGCSSRAPTPLHHHAAAIVLLPKSVH